MGLAPYAERFVAAGYAALIFDYRHFGDSQGQPRQLLSIGRQREDWTAAVKYARGLDGIDPDRIALFGTSFSGGHVLAVAAKDARIAAVISQCPFTDGLASSLKLNPAATAGVGVRATADITKAVFRGQPVLVPLAAAPKKVGLMNSADALPGYTALVPQDSTFRNEVAARIGALILLDRPGRFATKVTAPVLFCVCDNDSVAPAKQTLKYAAKAPRGEIKRYPVGHFDIYRGDPFETAVADQVAFLQRVLPVS